MLKEKKREMDLSKWKRWKKDGDTDALEELAAQYLPLVTFVANRLFIGLPNTVDKDDVLSCGRMGLLDALHKFDYTRGLQFETYAMWRIRGAMIDGLRNNDILPRSIRDKAKKVEEAYSILEQRYLRSVTDQEVSEFLHMSEKELHQILHEISFFSLLSLDEAIQDDEDQKQSRQMYVMDEKAKNPGKVAEQAALKEILVKTIDRLPEKERLVVSLFYYEELTTTEIAEVMNLSPSRISQLHSKAIFRIRGALGQLKDHIV